MNFVLFLLLAAALVVIQCLVGGARLADALGPFAILGIAGFFSLGGLRKPVIKPSFLCISSALLFSAYVIGRALFSPYAYLARMDICLSIACLVVYMLTAIYLTQARFRTGIVLTLCLMALAQVFVGAFQFAENEGFTLFGFTWSSIYAVRASGMFISPNHFAAFLSAVALFALSYTIWGRYSLPIKMFTAYVLLVCMGGIAISCSTSGYLCIFLGIAIFAAVSVWIVSIYNAPQFPLAVLSSILLLVAGMGTTLLLMKQSIVLSNRLVEISQFNKDLRKYHWQAAVDQIKVSPIFGTGAGTHPTYQRLFRRTPVQTDTRDSHSDYLDTISGYGAVGGVFAASFLLIHLFTGLGNIRKITSSRLMNIFGPPRTNSLALMVGAFTAAATMLLQSLFDSNLHTPANALILAFACGILSNSGINQDAKDHPKTFELGFRRTLGITGVVLFALSLHWYHPERISDRARQAVEAGQYAKADVLAAKAIAKDPTNPNNYYYRGEALRAKAASLPEEQRREVYNEAISLFNEGLKHSPENENLWVQLGQTLDATGRFAEAGEAFIQAIASDPNLGIIYAYYAEHLRLAGDPYGAMECAETARKLTGFIRKMSDLEDPLPSLNIGAPSLLENQRLPGGLAK